MEVTSNLRDHLVPYQESDAEIFIQIHNEQLRVEILGMVTVKSKVHLASDAFRLVCNRSSTTLAEFQEAKQKYREVLEEIEMDVVESTMPLYKGY